jgi:hypothetical protein
MNVPKHLREKEQRRQSDPDGENNFQILWMIFLIILCILVLIGVMGQ